MSDQPVAVVFGAGDGLGGAIARRFARGGYHACVVRRHADKLDGLCGEIREAGGLATAFGVDARKEEPVVEFFDRVEKDVGPVEVAVHNIGANVSIPIVDGPIDMPWIRENFPDLVKARPKDGLLQPDDLAESYWMLHSQGPERLDLRVGSTPLHGAVVAFGSVEAR